MTEITKTEWKMFGIAILGCLLITAIYYPIMNW